MTPTRRRVLGLALALVVGAASLALADGLTRSGGTAVPEAGGTVTLPGGGEGTITVTTDCTLEDERMRYFRMIQLELKGEGVRECRWLQFIYRVRKNAAGEEVGGWYQSKLHHPYGVDGRHVDTRDDDPFYDSEGVANRTNGESSIGDNPSVDPQDDITEVRAIADAFLICDGRVVFHVHWERVGRRNAGGRWERAYENVTGGAANGLPDWARGDDLHTGYPRPQPGNPITLTNPVPSDNRTPTP